MKNRIRIICSNMVFGITSMRPVVNMPSGRVRFRMRPDEFAEAFCREGNCTRRFYITEARGLWRFVEVGRNQDL
jgi:hypothetical protein